VGYQISVTLFTIYAICTALELGRGTLIAASSSLHPIKRIIEETVERRDVDATSVPGGDRRLFKFIDSSHVINAESDEEESEEEVFIHRGRSVAEMNRLVSDAFDLIVELSK
jgi:hypothetical protein